MQNMWPRKILYDRECSFLVHYFIFLCIYEMILKNLLETAKTQPHIFSGHYNALLIIFKQPEHVQKSKGFF